MNELMKLAAKYDACDLLCWDEDLKFLAICNDVFGWACADCEPIFDSDILDIQKAFEDAKDHSGIYLWIARKRGMRPQGAMYKYFTNEQKALFNKCGPDREAGMLNPVK